MDNKHKIANLSNTRTFLSLIRTTSIFAGLSFFLVKNNYKISACIILSLFIVINFINTVIYYKSSIKIKKENINITDSNKTYMLTSIFYSIILIVILIFLIYIYLVNKKFKV